MSGRAGLASRIMVGGAGRLDVGRRGQVVGLHALKRRRLPAQFDHQLSSPTAKQRVADHHTMMV